MNAREEIEDILDRMDGDPINQSDTDRIREILKTHDLVKYSIGSKRVEILKFAKISMDDVIRNNIRLRWEMRRKKK